MAMRFYLSVAVWALWMCGLAGCSKDSGHHSDSEDSSTISDSVDTMSPDSVDSADTSDSTDSGTATADDTDVNSWDTEGGTDFTARAAALVSEMTLEEKVSQMGHRAPSIPRLGVDAYNWWSEALHGVARSGIATVFPQSISLASTFDDQLMFDVATAISTEARVKSNLDGKGLSYWSPTINLARDPRWGRNEETYGEDPFLTSRMAVSFVRGMQGDDPVYLKTVSTIKHFIANNIEATRHTGSSNVDERNLREFYMPAFRAAVEEADVQSLMCAYNAVNDVPSCASSWLLDDVLRGEWGFSGYVVSDCWAIDDIVNGHGYASSNIEASQMALSAGTDLNCGDHYQADLVEAVHQGVVNEADIDVALVRLFSARFRLGEFDDPERVPYRLIPASALDSPENQALAHTAAVKSMVLLKNDGLLPLDGASISSIAVIGPNGDRMVYGGYSGDASAPVTPMEGIAHAAEQWGISVQFEEGTGLLGESTDSSIASAVSAASVADVAVVVLGTDLTVANEGRDRSDIALPAIQEELLEAVRAANPNTVLVLVTGMPLAINWAQENVLAILNAGYGGQAAGTAIAEVLFGQVNPAGRLPQTYYKSIADLPAMNDYDIILGKRTYMFFEGEVLYPFGHGLSYTQFEYSNLSLAQSGEDAGIEVSFDVLNAGTREGEEVAQVYVRDVAANAAVALQKLAGFTRVELAPGEVATVSVVIEPDSLSYFDPAAGQFVLEPGDFEVRVGASSADIRLQDTVTITP